jgi:hypothetical protein
MHDRLGVSWSDGWVRWSDGPMVPARACVRAGVAPPGSWLLAPGGGSSWISTYVDESVV